MAKQMIVQTNTAAITSVSAVVRVARSNGNIPYMHPLAMLNFVGILRRWKKLLESLALVCLVVERAG